MYADRSRARLPVSLSSLAAAAFTTFQLVPTGCRCDRAKRVARSEGGRGGRRAKASFANLRLQCFTRPAEHDAALTELCHLAEHASRSRRLGDGRGSGEPLKASGPPTAGMTPSLARLFGNKNEQPFRLNNLGAEMPADAPADTRAPLNGAGGATSPGASKPVPAGSPDQPSSAASGAKKKKNKPKKSATGAPASAEVSPDALNGGDASAETGEADPASAGAALLDSADVIDTVNNFVGLAMRASAAACGVGKERAGGAADGRSSSASPPPESVVMPPRPSSPWLDTPNGDSAERGARDTGSNGSQGFVTPDSEAGGEATPPSAFQDAPEERLREGEPDSDDEDAPAQMGADAQTTAAKRKKKKKKKAAASSVTGTVAGEAGKENISEVKQGQQRAGAADGTGASPSASGSAPGSTSSPAAPSSSSTSKPAKPIAPVKKESEGAEKLRSRREQLLSRRSVTTRPIRTQSGKAAAVSSDAKGVDPSLSKDQAEAIMSYTSQVFFHNYLRQVVGVNGAAGISVMQPRGSDDEREVISRKKRDEERQRQILENLRRMHGGEWELNSTPLAR